MKKEQFRNIVGKLQELGKEFNKLSESSLKNPTIESLSALTEILNEIRQLTKMMAGGLRFDGEEEHVASEKIQPRIEECTKFLSKAQIANANLRTSIQNVRKEVFSPSTAVPCSPQTGQKSTVVIGFEFQTFCPIRDMNLQLLDGKKVILCDMDGDKVLWKIVTDARDETSVKKWKTKNDGNPIGKASVMEFITEPFSKDKCMGVMRRIRLFNDVLLEKLKVSKDPIKLSWVCTKWQKLMTEQKLGNPVLKFTEDYLIGNPDEYLCMEYMTRPQATFDVTLSSLPHLLTSLAQSNLIRQDGQQKLKAVIQKAVTNDEITKLSPPVSGLACLLHLYLTVKEQGFRNDTVQQKPFHHFMVRRCFHSMWRHLNANEQVEWRNYITTLTKRYNDEDTVYPSGSHSSLTTLKVKEWLPSIETPWLYDLKVAKELSKILSDSKINPFREEKKQEQDVKPSKENNEGKQEQEEGIKKQKQVVKGFLQREMTKMTLVQAASSILELAEKDPDTKRKIDTLLSDSEKIKDRLCTLTEEAIGRWDYKQDVEVTFEWRSMELAVVPGDWADICEEVFNLACEAEAQAAPQILNVNVPSSIAPDTPRLHQPNISDAPGGVAANQGGPKVTFQGQPGKPPSLSGTPGEGKQEIKKHSKDPREGPDNGEQIVSEEKDSRAFDYELETALALSMTNTTTKPNSEGME